MYKLNVMLEWCLYMDYVMLEWLLYMNYYELVNIKLTTKVD